MALTTITYFKSIYGQAATDDVLTTLIDVASGIVRRHCRRDLSQTEYIHYFSLRQPSRKLVLRQYPVTAVTSVTLFPETESPEVINGSNVVFDEEGVLTFKESATTCTFVAGPRSVKVIYTAGFATIPDYLQYATASIAKRLVKSSAIDGLYQSETLGDYSYTLRGDALAAISDDTKAILNGYRSYVIGGD
jgi:hypothetical protein